MLQHKNICGGNFLYNHKTNARGRVFFQFEYYKDFTLLGIVSGCKIEIDGRPRGSENETWLNEMENSILGCSAQAHICHR